mmetsp:Transcript_15687/g.59664  ORF Transcript_15687/g.59664 Transcript_15687/m.59664 type:complete len:202 (-) Transcript_15687:1263-1868(-)
MPRHSWKAVAKAKRMPPTSNPPTSRRTQTPTTPTTMDKLQRGYCEADWSVPPPSRETGAVDPSRESRLPCARCRSRLRKREITASSKEAAWTAKFICKASKQRAQPPGRRAARRTTAAWTARQAHRRCPRRSGRERRRRPRPSARRRPRIKRWRRLPANLRRMRRPIRRREATSPRRRGRQANPRNRPPVCPAGPPLSRRS